MIRKKDGCIRGGKKLRGVSMQIVGIVGNLKLPIRKRKDRLG